jgi:oligopeptide transport system ATP-binding protein
LRETAPEPLLDVRDLEVYFPIRHGSFFPRTVGTVRAVDGVSFTIARGETLGLVGESGSGKSTVGRALLGIETTTAGRIEFDGADMAGASGGRRKALARRMQMVFQDAYASVDPRMRVGAIVAEPLLIHGIGDIAGRKRRVAELLDLVGLSARFASVFPHQLSGGQRQRVGIARALALEPEFIICDEAVSALDVSIQAQILNLLLDLQAKLGLTYLFIAHDIAVVRYISQRILVMYLGRVMEVADADALVSDPLHPYTRALMASVPRPDPDEDRARRAARTTVEIGSSARDTAEGCPFAPRCPSAAEVRHTSGIDCASVRPILHAAGAKQLVACHLYRGARP